MGGSDSVKETRLIIVGSLGFARSVGCVSCEKDLFEINVNLYYKSLKYL